MWLPLAPAALNLSVIPHLLASHYKQGGQRLGMPLTSLGLQGSGSDVSAIPEYTRPLFILCIWRVGTDRGYERVLETKGDAHVGRGQVSKGALQQYCPSASVPY